MPFSVMGTIVGGEHTLNQWVAHNIQFAQFDNGQVVDPMKALNGVQKAAAGGRG